jgi:hypothetical protein
MMALNFVNLNGVLVDTTPVKQKREKKVKEAHHDGWMATGISPESQAQARAQTERDGKAFDLQTLLRNGKRDKIRPQPYFSAAAAQEACDLAKRSGWIGCYPVEKKVK